MKPAGCALPQQPDARNRWPGRRERGLALLAMVALLVLVGLDLFVGQVSAHRMKAMREKTTLLALAQAKEALIGEAVLEDGPRYGRLPNPDLGPPFGVLTEGHSTGTAETANSTVVGRLPWKSLKTPPRPDQDRECLWYAVSGRFKHKPPSTSLNWDTPGQIDVVDANGEAIAANLAALIIAPGPALDAQDRRPETESPLCGGNYDARNYLDPYDAAHAIAGQRNYFPGSKNNRAAPDAGNKTFVLADNAHYNDRFIYVGAEEIVRRVIRRSGFTSRIGKLLDDSDLRKEVQDNPVSGASTKGTDNVNCDNIKDADNKIFCRDWKEMLLLTRLPVPASIIIDGLPSSLCTRVLIFGGKRTGQQVRITSGDRSRKENYLEGSNQTAFDTPVASSAGFDGRSAFDPEHPGADILRCLP